MVNCQNEKTSVSYVISSSRLVGREKEPWYLFHSLFLLVENWSWCSRDTFLTLRWWLGGLESGSVVIHYVHSLGMLEFHNQPSSILFLFFLFVQWMNYIRSWVRIHVFMLWIIYGKCWNSDKWCYDFHDVPIFQFDEIDACSNLSLYLSKSIQFYHVFTPAFSFSTLVYFCKIIFFSSIFAQLFLSPPISLFR